MLDCTPRTWLVVWAALSARLGCTRWIVIAGRKGMPCSHTTGIRIRPCSCSLDSAATVPSMCSLDLSEESTIRVGEAPVRSSSNDVEAILHWDQLLFSCSEVAPPSLSIARVLVVPSVPTPVEVGPSELSPVTDTTAIDIPSASIPVEIGITDASHAACSKSVVGIAPVSTPVEVVTSGSIQDSGLSSGWLDLSEESMTRVCELVTLARPSLSEVFATRTDRALLDLSEESMTRVGESVTTASSMRIPNWCSRPMSKWVARPLRGVHDSCRLSSFHYSRRPSDSWSWLPRNVDDVLRVVLCRLGEGSGVLLRGNSGRLIISLLLPWELDIFFEMLSWRTQHWSGVIRNQNGIRLISILWHYHDDGVHRELSECRWCLVNRCERH